MRDNEDTNINEITIPTGITDAWKLNHAYKQLLEEMNMQGYNSEYALVAIKNQIDKYNALEQSDFEVISELLYDDNHINEDKPIIAEKDISAIFFVENISSISIFDCFQSRNLADKK